MDTPSTPDRVIPTAIGDYRVDGILGQGGMGVVYRATHRGTGVPVALKTVLLPDEELLKRIRREIHALARVRHPGVVRIVDQGLDGGVPWYAMERIEGTTLDQLDAPDRADVLTLVRRLCAPLAFLHGEGIVHRDLKPGNVIVRPDGIPVLVDFGLIAETDTGLGREKASADHLAAGTPTYMAPEQISGTQVDARADLYALGCVLYELLAGRPPFTSTSAVGLAVAHLSEAPRPPSERCAGLPAALDELVMRLLAKRPEDRLGYAADVAGALAELGAHNGAGVDAPAPRIYLYRPGFAGREEALARLDARLRDLASGAGALVLVGGESGVGKTRLVLEAARRAADLEALVLVGEAVDGAVRPLEPLRKPLQAVADRCRELGSAETERVVGDRAAGLAQYEPSLAQLPGSPSAQPPAELSPDAARERLFRYLAGTFGALARQRPLLLIVDDLQWAGDLTLGFLTSLLRAERLAERAVLVVGTYRSEEVGDGLRRLLAEPAVEHLDLDRLDEGGVGSIVGDMLAMEAPPERLVGFVARQSEGNPFFVGEYLRTAVQEGLIFRDGAGRWQVVQGQGASAREFAALPVPGSLRDLVHRRLATLSPGAQRLLEAAAVIGREGELDLIQAVAGLDDGGLDDTFVELIRRHVAEETTPGTLRFVHDKLREAAYEAQGEDARRALHQRVAEILDDRPVEDAAYTFALAHHFARGEVERNPARVFETSAAAGARAVADNAPAAACGFFEQAARVADSAGLVGGAELEADWGEACAQLHRVSEAVEHLERALAGTTEPVRRSRLRARLSIVRLATWDSVSAWRECEHALTELGRPFPRSRLWQLLVTTWDWARGLVAGFVPALFGGARGEGRERLRALAMAYQTGMVVSYFEMDALNFFQMAIRALLPANRLGPSRELVEAYSPYAVAMGAMGLDRVGDRYAARAVEVAAEIGDVRLESGARYWQAVTTSFSGKAAQAVPAMREVLARHGRWLDTADFINGCADLTWNLAIRGYTREAWEVQELLQRKIRETRGRADAMEGHPSLSQQLVVLPLLGRAAEAREYYELARRIARERPDDRFRISFLSCNSLMFHLEQGELGEAVDEAIREYVRVSPPPALTLYHLRWFYVFQAYVWVARCEAAGEGERGPALGGLAAALGRLRQAANVGVLRSHLLAARGAYERLRGRPRRARRVLARAERLADEIDSPWIHFEVARQRAFLLRDGGDADAARETARLASALAERHGWAPRQARIVAGFELD
jgi:eukaryotic-like serine/threonine-protein kinase